MMFILSFSIFFVCLAVILLVPCVIPLWDSAAAHSPSGKELNPSPQEDARFSGRCTLAYNFLLHPASSIFGTQQQLTHPPVKSSTLLLKKIPVFQGIAPWHSILLHPASSLFVTQQQLTHPPVNSSTLPLSTNHVSKGLLLCDVPWLLYYSL